MSLTEQLKTQLAGRYTIEREIGKGGMATVFLARDVRHHREVALKVLDPELGAVLGADRFLGEIRVTANLQHPNLLPLFDSGEANGLLFYVMPFIEGESLRSRIDREKQLPVSEAVRIASAIGNALDYAHRHGVIHRDLKPENILLQEGEPLIADFGIALAVSHAGGQRVTQTGLSLGTPQYMSPEQATGDRNIDNRTDIYSLGALTYEMLAGEPPHSGTTSQAVIARLMTEEPRPLSTVRKSVPENVDSAVRCALEKLPADRFQTAKEFVDALNGRVAVPMHTTRPLTPATVPARRASWQLIAAAAAIGLGSAALTALVLRRAPEQEPVSFEVVQKTGETLVDNYGKSIDVSPDGRSIAYLARQKDGTTRIYVRNLGEWESKAIAGTDQPWEPRFSPDGKSIAFDHPIGPEVRKVTLTGSSYSTLIKGLNYSGGTWGSDGSIVVAGADSIIVIPQDGGTSRVVFRVSKDEKANDPFVIPSEGVIAFRLSGRKGSHLATVPLQGGNPTVFDLAIANVVGFDRGWLIFGRSDGTVAAVELKKHGTALGTRVVPLLEGVFYKQQGGTEAAFSSSGTLVYLTPLKGGILSLLDMSGRIARSMGEQRAYDYPAISPDGRKVVFSVATSTGYEIWIADLANNTTTKVIRGYRAQWMPDGRRVVYVDDSSRTVRIIPADGSSAPEVLTKEQYLEAFPTPDGKALVVRTTTANATGGDIFYLPLGDNQKAIPIVATPSIELQPRVSPDGKWLAYVHSEGTDYQVFVQPLMGGPRTQISTFTALQPVWSPDGKQLFYRGNSGAIYAATLNISGTTVNVTRRDSLFTIQTIGTNAAHQQYDIMPDGKQFVTFKLESEDRQLRVVTNWLSEARKKLR